MIHSNTGLTTFQPNYQTNANTQNLRQSSRVPPKSFQSGNQSQLMMLLMNLITRLIQQLQSQNNNKGEKSTESATTNQQGTSAPINEKESHVGSAPVAEAKPPVAEAKPPVAEAKPPVAEAKPPVAEAKPSVIESKPEGSIGDPEGSIGDPEGPIGDPEGPPGDRGARSSEELRLWTLVNDIQDGDYRGADINGEDPINWIANNPDFDRNDVEQWISQGGNKTGEKTDLPNVTVSDPGRFDNEGKPVAASEIENQIGENPLMDKGVADSLGAFGNKESAKELSAKVALTDTQQDFLDNKYNQEGNKAITIIDGSFEETGKISSSASIIINEATGIGSAGSHIGGLADELNALVEQKNNDPEGSLGGPVGLNGKHGFADTYKPLSLTEAQHDAIKDHFSKPKFAAMRSAGSEYKEDVRDANANGRLDVGDIVRYSNNDHIVTSDDIARITGERGEDGFNPEKTSNRGENGYGILTVGGDKVINPVPLNDQQETYLKSIFGGEVKVSDKTFDQTGKFSASTIKIDAGSRGAFEAGESAQKELVDKLNNQSNETGTHAAIGPGSKEESRLWALVNDIHDTETNGGQYLGADINGQSPEQWIAENPDFTRDDVQQWINSEPQPVQKDGGSFFNWFKENQGDINNDGNIDKKDIVEWLKGNTEDRGRDGAAAG